MITVTISLTMKSEKAAFVLKEEKNLMKTLT